MAQVLTPARDGAPKPSRLRRLFQWLVARLPKRLELRLLCAERVLRCGNFILIHDIERFEGYNHEGWPEPCTRWATTYRTDFPDEHDFLMVKAEAMRKFSKLPAHLKAENQL